MMPIGDMCIVICMAQLENMLKIGDKMICGILESVIVDNMSAEEKFKIVCKIKKINYQEIVEELIRRIQNSEIDDKDAYIGHTEVWDEEYIHIIQELTELYIQDDLLWSKEEAIEVFKDDLSQDWELDKLWIETTEEEKEIIKIAQECKLNEIKIEMM